MNLSILILKTGQHLITQVEQMEYEPSCHMVQPYLISGTKSITLTRWPSYTDDDHILLKSDALLTMVDPTEAILNKYLKKVGKKLEDFTNDSSSGKVVLNEDESVPEGSPVDEDDSYEPRYLEEDY